LFKATTAHGSAWDITALFGFNGSACRLTAQRRKNEREVDFPRPQQRTALLGV